MTVRVRFAPSPTGHLHIGGLRTALFNFLFARHNHGVFVLRIDDTDQERFDSTAEDNIMRNLAWAGITPDESPYQYGKYGPYRQSERLKIYDEAISELLEKEVAYRCYCTKSDLTAMRKKQMELGRPTRYDGRCRHLSDAQRIQYEEEGRISVVRMAIPQEDNPIMFKDLVRDRMQFPLRQLEDQIIYKSDGFPTYHLAAVVDDYLMEISHVLRGDEWLPSTPKYLLLCRWLDITPPEFAHLPLLLNQDRSKMSKRSGDATVTDFRRKGYLPQAMVNFLSLLGWSPVEQQEIFSISELESVFAIERIGKSPARFNTEKLDWLNKLWMGKMGKEALWQYLVPFISNSRYAHEDFEEIRKLVPVIQPQMAKLTEIEKRLSLFYRPEQELPDDKIIQALGHKISKSVLTSLLKQIDAMKEEQELDAETFNNMVKQVNKVTGFQGKNLLMPMRMAITLEVDGPDLTQIVNIFGKTKVRERLQRVLQMT